MLNFSIIVAILTAFILYKVGKFVLKKCFLNKRTIQFGVSIVNLLFAIIISICLHLFYFKKVELISNYKYGLEFEKSFALLVGLENGDIPLTINDKGIKTIDDFIKLMVTNNGKIVKLKRKDSIIQKRIPDNILEFFIKTTRKTKELIFPRIPSYILLEDKAQYNTLKVKANDRIIFFKDTRVDFWDELETLESTFAGKINNYKILRGLDTISLFLNEGGVNTKINRNKILQNFVEGNRNQKELTFLEAVQKGVQDTFLQTFFFCKNLISYFISDLRGNYRGLGGFRMLNSKFFELEFYLFYTVIFNVIIAFINLLVLLIKLLSNFLRKVNTILKI